MESKDRYPLGLVLMELLRNVNRKDKWIYIYFVIYTITASLFPFLESCYRNSYCRN